MLPTDWINWDPPPFPLHDLHDASVVMLFANRFLSSGAVQACGNPCLAGRH